MFIVQGVVPLFFAAMWWWAVEDHPSQARWAVKEPFVPSPPRAARGPMDTSFFRERNFWLLLILDVAFACGAYGLLMWLPSGIRSLGVTNNVHLGILSGLPYVFGSRVRSGIRGTRTGRATGGGMWRCRVS